MRTTMISGGHSLRRSVTLGLVLAALATIVAVGPAFGATAPPDYGSSVRCRYVTNSPGPAYEARIRRITVSPPVMFANSGPERVGWRFVVRRTIDALWPDYPSHHVTYRSPIQTAQATTANAADFETMSVGVVLPTVEEPRYVSYQVVIRMIRYRADGSVRSTTSYLMPTYTVRIRGNGWAHTEPGDSACNGVEWAAV